VLSGGPPVRGVARPSWRSTSTRSGASTPERRSTATTPQPPREQPEGPPRRGARAGARSAGAAARVLVRPRSPVGVLGAAVAPGARVGGRASARVELVTAGLVEAAGVGIGLVGAGHLLDLEEREDLRHQLRSIVGARDR